jgi:uncharacterized protein (DUF302 family)
MTEARKMGEQILLEQRMREALEDAGNKVIDRYEIDRCCR